MLPLGSKHLSDELRILTDICRKAGELERRYFYDADLVTEHKSGPTIYETPITRADREAEAIIENGLKTHFDKSIQFVGEETWQETYKNPEDFNAGKDTWYVDALDGTLEFVNQRTRFTINIGLVRNDVPVLGAIYAPMTGDYFVSDHTGAYTFTDRDDKPQRILTPRRITVTAVASKRPANDPNFDREDQFCTAAKIRITHKDVSAFRHIHVARGTAGIALFPFSQKQWDICAAHAFLRAAGSDLVNNEGQTAVYGNIAEGFKTPHLYAVGKVPEEEKNRILEHARLNPPQYVH